MRKREVPKYTVNTPQRNAHKPPTLENPARTDSFLASEIVNHSLGSSCKKTRKVDVLRDRGMSGEIAALGSVKILITLAIMKVLDCCRQRNGNQVPVPRKYEQRIGLLRTFPVQIVQRSCRVAATRDSEYP